MTLAGKAGQQVLPSAGITLIASPLGVSLGTAKRQDAPAFTEDKDLQDGSAVAAAVLEHLKQGTALLLLQSRIYMWVGVLLIKQNRHALPLGQALCFPTCCVKSLHTLYSVLLYVIC